jgi:hypothetical protein
MLRVGCLVWVVWLAFVFDVKHAVKQLGEVLVLSGVTNQPLADNHENLNEPTNIGQESE